ncbi:MAG: radical SAM protein, partial [Cyclobacteriaceae bacterium]
LDDLEWAFGNMGMQDKAKHLATLYLEDISDFIIECIDENFGFSRYAEKLGMSANQFDELYESLQQTPTFIDTITIRLLQNKIEEVSPKMVCLSVPFPGNLYSAFRCAQWIKKNRPGTKIAMGGGFANTELRSVSDPRVFEFFDYITLDDGELPIELLANKVIGRQDDSCRFKRTFLLENDKVVYRNDTSGKDYRQSEVGTPDYSDLLLDQYISVIELANPMHSLWSDGRWNKLTMAHGCYWGKCTFCDVSLDYIKLYEPVAAGLLADRMEELIAQTGETGFHFVDEAAPPALMRALAIEIIKRGLIVTWWTNIRFEKSFTIDLCKLLKASGCIAVSGGLEVASDRLLKLIDKGVTVEQVARVVRNFTECDIMVHAYLMYGYPTQTVQETVDSLEMVRQLFESGILQSGFWHQFALTVHSPVGRDPQTYNIVPHRAAIGFADNDVQFTDSTGIDHNQFSFGLKKSLFNYMHGMCFDYPLQEWFDFEIPDTSISPDFIANALATEPYNSTGKNAVIVWTGNDPLVDYFEKKKHGKIQEYIRMIFSDNEGDIEITMEKNTGEWLTDKLPQLEKSVRYVQFKKDFENELGDFEPFWYSKPAMKLREHGLLCI